LELVKNPVSDKIIAKIKPQAREENGMRWWSRAKEQPGPDALPFTKAKNNDIELNAYLTLTLMLKEPVHQVLPNIKWLISQRNSNGGFSSTQDTVVGLTCLTRFAEAIGSGAGEMQIRFKGAPGEEAATGSFALNQENSLVLETHDLPRSTRQIEYTAEGSGSALFSLSYQYNVADKEKKPSFAISTKVKDNELRTMVNVNVCTEFKPLEDNQQQDSNMAILEIGLPSGYVADLEKLPDLLDVKNVKRAETKNEDSTVIVYFDGMTPNATECVEITANKVHAVAKQKPAAVSMYDYYDTSRKATEFYTVASSLCDICEGTDCGSDCKK